MSAQESELMQAATRLLYSEARYLDERRWEDWLALYAPECIYWMPMWRDDETLNDDPAAQLSLIYYDRRKGLEDRIARIRSPRRSPASTPLPRTSHQVTNVLALDPPEAARLRLRVAWSCHVLFLRTRHQHVFFGSAEYLLRREAESWLIHEKKILLQNDDIPTMLDIYCI